MRNESKGVRFLGGSARAAAISEYHVKYVCEQCSDSVLLLKGDGLCETIVCQAPCYGVMRPQKFWEEKR